MKTTFTITQASQTELPAIIAWFTQNYYADDGVAANEHFADHFTDGGATLLAKTGGAIAGFITIRWVSHNRAFQKQNIPLIHHLEVFDPFQGQGIGDALMAAAEKLIATRATKAGVTVGIFDAYGPAQRLYAKRGYIPDGRGVCKGHTPIKLGEVHQIDHDLIFWLTKDLHERSKQQ